MDTLIMIGEIAKPIIFWGGLSLSCLSFVVLAYSKK